MIYHQTSQPRSKAIWSFGLVTIFSIVAIVVGMVGVSAQQDSNQTYLPIVMGESASDTFFASSAASLSCTDIASKPSGFGGRHGSGDKPQSKTWEHGGSWWAVFPTTSSGASSAGTWLWKLQNNAWVEILKLSSAQDVKADVKSIGNVVHILLYAGSSTELVSAEFSGGTYIAWTGRPSGAVSINLSGSEIATIDIDSQGRMWLATETSNKIIAYYSDSPYSTWNGPADVATGITSDDIGVVVAMPGNKIGVFWSDQGNGRFGFRTHADGAAPNSWSAIEDAATGSSIADDHVNVAVADNGDLFAAVKTGGDRVALLVRRSNGTWESPVNVDNSGVGTRPIVVLDEASDMVTFIYTAANGPNDILYKQSAMNPINFGARMTLSAGGFNDPSSTKQNYTSDLVVIFATDEDSNNTMDGVFCTTGSPPSNTATPTSTDVPQSTSTPTSTDTPVSTDTPTATATDTIVVPNTATPTATDTDMPLSTSTPTATDTNVIPNTATPTATDTDMPLSTSTPTATDTNVIPNTATPTATDTSVVSDTATPTATATDSSVASDTATPTATPTETLVASDTATPTATATIIPGEGKLIYVSSSSGGNAGGVPFENEDILVYDTFTHLWAMFFNGSNVGLGATNVDAFDLLPDGSLLMSLAHPFDVPGVGHVSDADVLRFIPEMLGPITQGHFELYFRGANVGLTEGDEDINALTTLHNGALVLSTRGAFDIPESVGRDEDLISFMPTQRGEATDGEWTFFFNGIQSGLRTSSEDINALWIHEHPDHADKMYLSTRGSFRVPGLSGDRSDIFGCMLASPGSNATCTFHLEWDGSEHGFEGERLDALSVRKRGHANSTVWTLSNIDAASALAHDAEQNGGSGQVELPEDIEYELELFMPLVQK